VLAGLVALTVNPVLIIWVVVIYTIITTIEAHILVPLIYGRMVHLHPFLVIVALLFGVEAFGLIGAIIAVPIAAALHVAVQAIYVKDVVAPADKAWSRGKRAPIDLTTLYQFSRRRGRHAE
ncbi:MAG: AI-2E family transporter, partial [Chloroflexota bacterium]